MKLGLNTKGLGKAKVSVFYGDYEITERTWQTKVSLEKKKEQVEIKVGK